MISEVALKMLQISLEASIVILFVLVLTPLLKRKYSAKLRYYIWLALAIRLVIPFSFSLPNSLSTYLVPKSIVQAVVSQNSEKVTLSNKVIVKPETPAIAVTESDDYEDTAGIQYVSKQNMYKMKQNILYYLPLIWMLGIVVLVTHQLIAYIVFYSLVNRWSRCNSNLVISNCVNKVMLNLNMNNKITILHSKMVSSPMLIGFVKPKLVLPELKYSELDLQNIIKHELIHLKRHDIWFKLLLQIVKAVHWYNPLIYIMQNQAFKTIELSCDEEVVKGLTIDCKKQYSYTILNSIIEQQQNNSVFPSYFYNSSITTKERIKNIMNHNKKKKGSLIFIMLLVCVCLTGSLLVYGADQESKQQIELSKQDQVFLNYIAELKDNSLAINYHSIEEGNCMIYTIKSLNKREILKVYLEQVENTANELVWTVKKHKYLKQEYESMYLTEAWIEAQKYHDNKALGNLLSDELKKQYLSSEGKVSWDDLAVEKYEATFNDYGCLINYFLKDIDSSYYDYQETLTFGRENNKLVIESINDEKQINNPTDNSKSHVFSSDINVIFMQSKDPETLLKKYRQGLLNDAYTTMLLLTNDVNFDAEELARNTIKVSRVEVINKEVKENKACYKLEIDIDNADKSVDTETYTRWLYMKNSDSNDQADANWQLAGLLDGAPSQKWWNK